MGYFLYVGCVPLAVLGGALPQAGNLVGLIDETVGPFLDVPSVLIVLGGTLALAVTTLGGSARDPRARLARWQQISLVFFMTSLIGGFIGLIGVLVNVNNPNNIGPAMAVLLLSALTALVGASLTSFPMEDRTTKAVLSDETCATVRIVWYALPLAALLWSGLGLALLFSALGMQK